MELRKSLTYLLFHLGAMVSFQQSVCLWAVTVDGYDYTNAWNNNSQESEDQIQR